MPEITFSEIVEPTTVPANRSAFSQAILSIPTGKALVIGGMLVSAVSSRANALGAKQTPHRKFTCATMDDKRIQVTRIS